jgi:hypothetical protein
VRQVDIRRRKIDPRQDAVAMPQHVVPKHLDAAFGGQQQAEQHRQGRRLAGAIAAEERRGDAVLDGKADPGNGDRVAVTLDQIVDFYDGREHRAYMAYCWGLDQIARPVGSARSIFFIVMAGLVPAIQSAFGSDNRRLGLYHDQPHQWDSLCRHHQQSRAPDLGASRRIG